MIYICRLVCWSWAKMCRRNINCVCMYVYKYNVDIYLLCMIKVRVGGVLVVWRKF